MRRIKADLFIQRCSFHDAPRVWLFSKLLNAKFLFWIGIDYNVDIKYIRINLSPLRRFSYLLALKKADILIAQTKHQASLLKSISNSLSKTISNIVSIPPLNQTRSSNNKLVAIWGGRINPRKKPEKLLELAAKAPTWTFFAIIVKERGLEREYDEFVTKSNHLSNLTVIHSLPHEEYLRFHDSVSLVLNTASTEGYPNTLLEAFARSVPALTLGIDPDQAISKNGIGWVYTDIKNAAIKLNYLAEHREELILAGNNARKYAEKHHSFEKAISDLDHVLTTIL